MSGIAEQLSDRRRVRGRAAEGRLVDLNTGRLRCDHVLIQQAAGADLFIGFGAWAARALDFAFREDDAEGDLIEKETQHASGFGDLAATDDRHLRRLAFLEALIAKASPDDPVHPGYPAGEPGGRGGQFRPKDSSAEAKETTTQRLKRQKSMREFRWAARTAMVVSRTAAVGEIPVLDAAAAIEGVVEIGITAIKLGNDERRINRAIKFVQKGPYTLDDLRVDKDDASFSSFEAFKKITPAELLARRYPMAESGGEYHHIVEQGGDNDENFSPNQLQSTRNIIPLPKPLHELVSAEYSKEYDKSGKTVRQWLSGQSFEAQWNEGIKILRDVGILK